MIKECFTMNFLQQIDATIIVATIALIGTFTTVMANKAGKKQDTIIETNEQLMAMLKSSQEEIRLLKEQHAQESQRLENKIVQLTEENQELRNEVYKLNNYLVKLGITI